MAGAFRKISDALGPATPKPEAEVKKKKRKQTPQDDRARRRRRKRLAEFAAKQKK